MKPNEIERNVDNLNSPQKRSRRGKSMRRKFFAVMAVIIGCLVITASAALLTYYGKIETTATVSQSVLLDGKDYTTSITNEFNTIGGCCKWSCHDLENTGCEDAPIVFDTQYWPDDDGITTKYYTPTHYTFQTLIGTQPVLITVEDGECHVTWTIDFPIDDDPCNGLMQVGLIIAQDGDDNGPSFQIHNNDGTDHYYPFGTWLYSPWGPTIDDGWYGWHSGWNGIGERTAINIPVEELSCQWIECTGHRYKDGRIDDPIPNPEGIFTIKIAKCVLGEDFHWAIQASLAQFCQYAYQQAYYPTGFSWSSPIVNDEINYEHAVIMTNLGTGFTLGKYQSKEIIICHCFDIAILPGTYYITSQFQPGP